MIGNEVIQSVERLQRVLTNAAANFGDSRLGLLDGSWRGTMLVYHVR